MRTSPPGPSGCRSSARPGATRRLAPVAGPVLAGTAAVLLLAGCGTQTAATAGARTSPEAACVVPGDPVHDAGPDAQDVRITSLTGGHAGCGGTAPDAPLRVGFTVANHGTTPMTYAITFTLFNDGGAWGTVQGEVADVAPGGTGRAVVDAGAQPRIDQVRVAKARSVPAAEAPAAVGPCPPSGVRLTATEESAAMGLRVRGLRLTNCSDRPYRLDGFPRVELFDEDHDAVTGVAIAQGSGGISTGTGFDDPVRALTLAPGQSATSGLLWRNTVTDGTPVNAPYARIYAKPGAAPVMVTPELDLGTTGKLGVGPWRKAT
ncbi:DUF4232 domain-containing protein [Actinacidiphila epipremni]|uniref:DUF4232 domain-containing protein n=1 Tax=Actinacidiphila epipremni TaxID=2053013 RepID=A0ABX0ZXL5_9ACTN|nr:DUF4232 domain-containing protein [Actinacidiphila epipremni]NJP46163.1 DUF4232 domain-containing protein [Actinacidiphila epipremni]